MLSWDHHQVSSQSGDCPQGPCPVLLLVVSQPSPALRSQARGAGTDVGSTPRTCVSGHLVHTLVTWPRQVSPSPISLTLSGHSAEPHFSTFQAQGQALDQGRFSRKGPTWRPAGSLLRVNLLRLDTHLRIGVWLTCGHQEPFLSSDRTLASGIGPAGPKEKIGFKVAQG